MNPIAITEIFRWLEQKGFAVIDRDFFVNNDFLIKGFASIEKAGSSDVSFWLGNSIKSETNANGFSHSLLMQIKAGLVFIPENFKSESDFSVELKQIIPHVRYAIPVKNPYHVMVEFLKTFGVSKIQESKISKTAIIHPSAVVEGSVGDNCYIGPNCVVMQNAKIGANCRLESNVTIYQNVCIGEENVFQAGVVIGSSGFGFYEYEGERRVVPHLAGVEIGNRNSFGANMVVAAGFVSPTIIGNNCHFDSFVQIAHNCVLGNNIYMASQSGIAGTVIVEDNVEFAGGAQSAGHLTIGKGTHIAAKAGVTKNVAAGKTVAGFPAMDIDLWRRSVVKLRMMGK